MTLTTTDTYITELETWRQQAEATLRADDGWLTVAGLFWLAEGENRAGADADLPVALPEESAPAYIGTFIRTSREVTFHPAAGVPVLVNGEPTAERVLRSDAGGGATPDMVTIGTLTMFVIERGERIGIRLRDRNSPLRREFAGRHWFAPQPEYCVEAEFVPYNPPKTVAITDVLGDTNDMTSPGYVRFTLDGHELQLDATGSAANRLFIVFRDLTAGHETYGAARFLYTAPPRDGRVILDFNRAVNPPCAFTPHATCPLPLPQNRLPVRIPAGERYEH